MYRIFICLSGPWPEEQEGTEVAKAGWELGPRFAEILTVISSRF